MKTLLSLSAVANGHDFTTAVEDATVTAINLGYQGIEYAIGARAPTGGPSLTHHRARRHFHRVSVIEPVFHAHHAVPIGVNKVLRPESGPTVEFIRTLKLLDINRYSMHPPTWRQIDNDRKAKRFLLEWSRALGDVGIGFAVETMYPITTASEHQSHKRHRLMSYVEVNDFLVWMGYPLDILVFDAAHVYIGYQCKIWTDAQVKAILRSGVVSEFHFSSNDGRRDIHRVLSDHPIPKIQEWIDIAIDAGVPYFVDEGRRK